MSEQADITETEQAAGDAVADTIASNTVAAQADFAPAPDAAEASTVAVEAAPAEEPVPEHLELVEIPVGSEIVKGKNGWWTFKVPGRQAVMAEGPHVAQAAAKLGLQF